MAETIFDAVAGSTNEKTDTKAEKFLLISSGSAVPASGNITISYPSGYTKQNTIVITRWTDPGNKYYVSETAVALEDGGIRFANSTGNAVVMKALIGKAEAISVTA